MTHEITLNEKYLMKNKQDQKKGNFKNKNLYYIYNSSYIDESSSNVLSFWYGILIKYS